MFNFPFNTTGSELEGYLNDGCLKFWYDPAKFRDKRDYMIPDSGPKRQQNHSKVLDVNQLKDCYDSTNVNYQEYVHMRDNPKVYIHDQTLVLWNLWLLRHPDSPEAKDVAIIPPFIAKGIIEILYDLSNPGHFTYQSAQSLKQGLDAVKFYLYGHPQLLEKRLIFL